MSRTTKKIDEEEDDEVKEEDDEETGVLAAQMSHASVTKSSLPQDTVPIWKRPNQLLEFGHC